MLKFFSPATEMKTIQTDNSHLDLKLEIRREILQEIMSANRDRKTITVLDCFAGKGLIWSSIASQFEIEYPHVSLSITPIEKRKNLARSPYLVGDNMKFLTTLDLNQFDIIDLDAYGVPIQQLLYILQHPANPYVCLTAILILYGRMPDTLLIENGIPLEMYKKIPSLFTCKFKPFLLNLLLKYNVKTIKGYFSEKPLKMYVYFKKEKN